MSLVIDSRYITGIYALGQWFKVEKDSVWVDAYEFTNWEEPSPHDGDTWKVRHTNYLMGQIYPDPHSDGPSCGMYSEHSKGGWAVPGRSHGIAFVDADTGERVSFSLIEVRAFREDLP